MQICKLHGIFFSPQLETQASVSVREGGGCCAPRDRSGAVSGSQCSLRSPGQGMNESSLLSVLYCLTTECQDLAERSGLFTKTSGSEVRGGGLG